MYLHTQTHTPQFVYPSTDGHLGYNHLLATVNSTTINLCVHVFVCVTVFNSLGYTPKGGNVGHTVILCLTF